MSDYEEPSCITYSTPRARVSHWCCECHHDIKPGDRYQRITGVWDGRGDTFKTCLNCVALRELLDGSVGPHDEPAALGHLVEWIDNEIDEVGHRRWLTGLAKDDASSALVGRALGLLWRRDEREHDVREMRKRERRQGETMTIEQAESATGWA